MKLFRRTGKPLITKAELIAAIKILLIIFAFGAAEPIANLLIH